MDCEKCKEQDDCTIYQEWLNTRDVCCPFGDYQKNKKKATCDDIKKTVNLLKKYEIKPDKNGMINIYRGII